MIEDHHDQFDIMRDTRAIRPAHVFDTTIEGIAQVPTIETRIGQDRRGYSNA
jgi:hypothetical protein